MAILNAALAQDIVTRTMQIIPINVNVMDDRGTILASGEPGRIGELHDGALLALAQKRTVEISQATARNMHSARPGINLPLRIKDKLVGVVGLTGTPDKVRQFAELVRLSAEMILEQAVLIGELQRDTRFREALVLSLIGHTRSPHTTVDSWAERLGLDFRLPHSVLLLELLHEQPDTVAPTSEIQRLQMRMASLRPGTPTAITGPQEMVILESCSESESVTTTESNARRCLHCLDTLLQNETRTPYRLTMGVVLKGKEGVEQSYQSARTTALSTRQRHPQRRATSYYDFPLPVLLSGLDHGWQARQLRRPLAQLKTYDKENGSLQRTLMVWFQHNRHAQATTEALHIHRNTLDYRLKRIGEITGMDLGNTDDCTLLYIALQLDA